GVGELGDLTFRLEDELALQVAVGDGRDHAGDTSHLGGEVARHGVDVVGQVFPYTADTLDLGLTAQLAFSAHVAGHARHLVGEGVALVDHDVDGVLELADRALDVDGDLARQVAVVDRGRDVGDVADLGGEVARHGVHVVGEVFPYTADALHLGLPAQLAFGAHLAGDARHLVRECIELVDHRVDGVLQLEDLAANVDGDLPRKVALLNRRGDLSDVAHLAGEVAGHEVHVFGEVFPDTADTFDVRLPTQLAVGAHLAGHARHLGG